MQTYWKEHLLRLVHMEKNVALTETICDRMKPSMENRPVPAGEAEAGD